MADKCPFTTIYEAIASLSDIYYSQPIEIIKEES